jgi:methionine-rich copper-binding protein CopC
MTRYRLLMSAALLCCAALAQAHTEVKQTMPAEGSTVQSPRQLMFMFSEAARLTALSIQKEGEAAQKIEALPAAASAHVMVAVPQLSTGKYTVTWRAIGKDEHIVSGSLHFTVSDKAPGMGMGMGSGMGPGMGMGMGNKPGADAAPKPATPSAPAAPADDHATHQH